MSDGGDVIKWIRYLHAALQVPKGDPDYADAQAAVQLAKRKIAFLNRSANRADVETPDALETARMAGLANTAGAVASAPVAPALAAMGGTPLAMLASAPLEAFLSRIAGNAALDARGVDVNAYERGMEAHPTATAVGEMVPPVLMALAGRLGTKPAARFISETATRPLPELPPARPTGFMTNTPAAGAGAVSQTDPMSRLLALLGRRPRISVTNTPPIMSRPLPIPPSGGALDEPTFLRNAAAPTSEPAVNAASAEIARRLMLLRGWFEQ